MLDILGKPFFLQFMVPLLTVSLTVFLRFVTRNDNHRGFRWDDLAVGLNVSVTALMIFVTDTVATAGRILKASNSAVANPTERIVLAPWIILALVIGIWGVSTVVRKLGWRDQDQLKPFWGIVFPDLYGLCALLFVVNWLG